MDRLKMKLGVTGAVAAALALAGGLMLATQVSAVSGELGVGSATIPPGGFGSVDITANVPDPGLGAWALDLDHTGLTLLDCVTHPAAVCGPEFKPSVLRTTGQVPSGLIGEVVLATLTFQCPDAEADYPLDLQVSVFADGTPGGPQNITTTAGDGVITCAVLPTDTPPSPPPPAEPTATPVPGGPTNTPAPAPAAARLPSSGTGGGSDGSSSVGWLIAAIAGAGLAGIAGYGALRLRKS
ncbi:MAG: hypothetical protein U1B78_05115 [Dehalococcoidia bacterium]|nr:hypothetical protein [Dehalococcoidia bacterium]